MIKLIKGNFINLFYIFLKNEYFYNIKFFIDSKINNYIFINKIFFLLLFSIFKSYILLFNIIIKVKSYNSIEGKVITYYIFFNFIIFN